ncbi:EAL domain-containing response regulator [Thiosulfativibrio zosterae]|uniref:Signal transduction protein n=1 Tax=Thiosulfativibrio zosterae TaxID=2675053 RepID=A0A6F8PN92_9GAMM|nr:EAL domain-containing response regulator [Thiosulfativibrio zosterae]BBP43460.1 signal transduction protein [Thiosulfativibrio zosterae]
MPAKVFVLDDESLYGQMIAEFADLYHLTTIAHDDASNLETLLTGIDDFSLFFLDLHMPKHDGIEVLRLLESSGYQGKIVLMSGFDESVLASAYHLAVTQGLRVVDTLSKPFNLDKLRGILAEFASEKNPPNLPVRQASAEISKLSHEMVIKSLYEDRFILHYQPQIRLVDHKLIGLECLVRLKGDQGLIYPGQFIEVIEQNALTNYLIMAVVRKLCEDYQRCLSQIHEVTFSINVSALDLDNLTFPDFLADLIAKCQLSPQQIVIEITESRAIEQIKIGLDVLTRLRLKGFHLSIDDFGTGTAVLSNIKNMPFNELKIDKSFVDRLTRDGRTNQLTQDLIHMAHNLKLMTVAEGVENIESLNILKKLGCQIVQGYYFAKPMAAEDLMSWVAQNQWD